VGPWEVWRAGIGVGGRTLPIGWAVIPYPWPKGRYRATTVALSTQLQAAFPPGVRWSVVAVYFTEFCQAFHAKAATWFTRALPPWDRVRRGWSERSDACPKFLILGLLGLGSDCQFVRAFPPGVSFQRNFIGVMDEAI